MVLDKVEKLIVHCSDSPFGDVKVIDQWHKARGWDGIGYHFVILNGCPTTKDYIEKFDGVVELGRNTTIAGAHCRGHNKTSVGICVIGQHHFTGAQLLKSLPELLERLMEVYRLTVDDVYGHHELDDKKTCPNLDMGMVRDTLRMRIEFMED